MAQKASIREHRGIRGSVEGTREYHRMMLAHELMIMEITSM